MADPVSPSTHLSLFADLAGPEPGPDVWTRVVGRYRPLLLHWCRTHGLQDADAEDVTQTVLARMLRRLADTYDTGQPFRPWLRVVVRNAVRDHFREARGRPGAVGDGGSTVHAWLQRLPEEAVDGLTSELNADQERLLSLLDEAERRTREAVRPEHWQVYELFVKQSVPGPDVARQLGRNLSSIYVEARRVLKRVRETALELERQA